MSNSIAINNSNVMRILSGAIAASLLVISMIASAGEKKAESQDIVDVAVANGSFNTLAAALKAGGLIDVLKGDGPFTVFAPTD